MSAAVVLDPRAEFKDALIAAFADLLGEWVSSPSRTRSDAAMQFGIAVTQRAMRYHEGAPRSWGVRQRKPIVPDEAEPIVEYFARMAEMETS